MRPVKSPSRSTFRLRLALLIRDAGLVAFQARGREEKTLPDSPPFPVAEVAGLDLIFMTPSARPPDLPAEDAWELALYEQQTGRSVRTLDWGLDVFAPQGKVLSLEWTRDQSEFRLSRFDRGHWEDDLLRATDECVGGDRADAWLRGDVAVDVLVSRGVAAAVDDRYLRRRHFETVSLRHRGSTVHLLETLMLPPAVVARVNRSLFGPPTARFMWWAAPHEAFGGKSVVRALAAGYVEDVVALARRSPLPGLNWAPVHVGVMV
jgi:hypothetical protein